MRDFWETMDIAVSALAAEHGGRALSWSPVRDYNQPAYRVIVRSGDQVVAFPPPSPHPITDWLSSMGYSEKYLALHATSAVNERIDEAAWFPVREPQNQWIRGTWRRPSLLLWQQEPALASGYWSSVLAGQGVEHHAWLRELRQDLAGPVKAPARRRVLGNLARMMSHYNNWEAQSGFSLRAWSVGHPEWQDVLDKAGLDYRGRVDGVPLLVAALEAGATTKSAGWRRILKGAVPSNHLLEAVLQPQDIPSSWWDAASKGQPPAAPLWCWAARHAHPESWEVLLSLRPDLLELKDSEQHTALHWAAAAANAPVVEMLLAHGASPASVSLHGRMPEELVPEGKDALYERIAAARMGPARQREPK
jgi:hypothetical protein